MVQLLTRGECIDQLMRYGMSRRGAAALVDFFAKIESETGRAFYFDAMAACCEYSEYSSIAEAARYYNWRESDGDPKLFLLERTPVIEFNDGVIIANKD